LHTGILLNAPEEVLTASEETNADPFEGIKTEDIEDFAELFDTPPPSSDKEAFEMAKKIRKWVADGRPK